MATKHSAKLNGEIVGKRTSKNRVYSHAVVVAKPTEVNYFFGKGIKDSPHVYGWCSRPDLAVKSADPLRKWYEVVHIVPAEII